MAEHRTMASDQELFERIWYAVHDKQVDIGVNLRRLNKPGSPVFNTMENGLPLLIILFGVVAAVIAGGILWGLAILASGVILFLTVINIWVMDRLRRRTMQQALSGLTDWQSLWDLGGLSLRLLSDRAVESDSAAEDDWRGFARRHLRQQAGQE
jgi:hypothetical protein